METKTEVTHQVSTPNKRPPTSLETLREQINKEFSKTVESYYRSDAKEAMVFKTAVVDYVRRVPKLLECDRISLLSAFATAAQFNFMPSGVSGECYIIPYGNEAKFQVGYQGIVTLLYRNKKILAISSNIVYANDDFNYEEGLEPRLYHKPVFGKERGDAIGVYTVAQLAGGARTFKVMSADQVKSIKGLSKAKDSKESPWNSDKDPELWMWRKTCLIQHSKLLPRSRELIEAIEKDYEGEGYNRGNLDAGGPAVAKSFHDPESVA